MKTIGLIGAGSWQETAAYLEAIQRAIAGRLGCGHTPKVILQTFDAAHIALLASQGKWSMIAYKMAGAARNLEQAGASCVAICGLGMHAAAGEIEGTVRVPLLHVLDPVAAEMERLGLRKVDLLYGGSSFEDRYLRTELNQRLGPRILVPLGSPSEAFIVDYALSGARLCAPLGRIVLDTLPLHACAIANFAIG